MSKKIKDPVFKRPNHPDFKTSSELKQAKFTGLRENNMALEYEFWVLGEIRKTVKFIDAQKDPMALQKAHMEVFLF